MVGITSWRCCIITDKIRVNEKIRGKEFRIISSTGEQLGVMTSNEALEIAKQEGLDLVEIAANAKPPVCKIMNFGKYRYEQTRKAKEAKKNQKQTVVKEVKVTARIDSHDLETKMSQIERFLAKENKVKVTLVLFGRERMHPTLGVDTLEGIAEKFAEIAEADKKYNERQKHIILTPKKQG
ncbi:translation initiation factor IF-3 [Fusobacterium sp.]|jgi:translation initiation factor IF-3|uniref:translation initiation factor IF-3 n=1 Tax=Fusobacterium sp. TaxID=68766 RepID=UPI000C705EA7|nr:translation initiation factor IF-3 [Fusobacterium sp.]